MLSRKGGTSPALPTRKGLVMIIDGEFFEAEDDYAEGDYLFDGSDVWQCGKVVLRQDREGRYFVPKTGEEFDTLDEGIETLMRRENFFPNVWTVSDHGNMEIMLPA